MPKKSLHLMVLLATALAFVVVILGAYTRLSNAGLGCPDWPGCYGHLFVPEKADALTQVATDFPGQVVEAAKAWKEMIHRYAAGTLGLFILAITAWVAYYRKQLPISLTLPVVLCVLLLLQATLGMLTVTLLLLPLVVMGHLLGGMAILSVLWCLHWPLSHKVHEAPAMTPIAFLCWVGVVLIVIQLALGGWVSTNYAGLSCVGFPLCNGHLFPHDHWMEAFNLFSPVGANYEGGVLSSATRATIQMVHRLWAYGLVIYLGSLAGVIFVHKRARSLRINMLMVLSLLAIQIALGIVNVLDMLPLSIAVMHNATAALLLLAMLSLTLKARTLSLLKGSL